MDEIKQDMEMDKDNMEENNKNNIDDNAIKNKIGQNKNNIICDNNNVIEENIYNNNCIINENNIEEKNKEDNNGQTNNQSQIETNIIYDDKKDFMNNINECNNNDDGLKSNEITQNIYKYIEDKIESLKGIIESQNAKIEFMKELHNTEIKLLKQELKEVKDDQRLLWCHFCLASNSRDIFKSITYYLYTYLNLRGDSDNYRKLISIIKFLKQKNNNLFINKETLLKFLKLDKFY
jgi:hypothetical protein